MEIANEQISGNDLNATAIQVIVALIAISVKNNTWRITFILACVFVFMKIHFRLFSTASK